MCEIPKRELVFEHLYIALACIIFVTVQIYRFQDAGLCWIRIRELFYHMGTCKTSSCLLKSVESMNLGSSNAERQ